MKQTVARFFERLDFEAIILHEKASGGDTIIEKFERNSDVSYAVVLLSPDDVGAASDKRDKLQARARQNVVLELGYFIGKLGRSHVCPIVRGQIEAPSDFHGVVYVPFEGEDWKFHLVKELKHLGFDIDANKALHRSELVSRLSDIPPSFTLSGCSRVNPIGPCARKMGA